MNVKKVSNDDGAFQFEPWFFFGLEKLAPLHRGRCPEPGGLQPGPALRRPGKASSQEEVLRENQTGIKPNWCIELGGIGKK